MSSANDIVWTDVNLEPLERGTGSAGMMTGGMVSAETDADIITGKGGQFEKC